MLGDVQCVPCPVPGSEGRGEQGTTGSKGWFRGGGGCGAVQSECGSSQATLLLEVLCVNEVLLLY